MTFRNARPRKKYKMITHAVAFTYTATWTVFLCTAPTTKKIVVVMRAMFTITSTSSTKKSTKIGRRKNKNSGYLRGTSYGSWTVEGLQRAQTSTSTRSVQQSPRSESTLEPYRTLCTRSVGRSSHSRSWSPVSGRCSAWWCWWVKIRGSTKGRADDKTRRAMPQKEAWEIFWERRIKLGMEEGRYTSVYLKRLLVIKCTFSID